MKTIKYIVSFIDRVNSAIGLAVSMLFIPLTCISLLEVFMRYVLNKPTIWAWDMNMQIFAALVMMGGGYTLLHNSHVSVDVVVINMPRRKKALLDLITAMLFFIAMLFLIIKGWEIGWTSFKRGETDATIWGPPLWTIKLWVPIGAFFVLIQGVSKFLKDLVLVVYNEDIRRKEV